MGGIQNSELMYSATIVSKSLGIFSPFLVFNYCCFLSWVLFQARLNEIITSGATIHSNGMSKKPWMVDGAGLPSNASELLPELVKFSLLEIWKHLSLFEESLGFSTGSCWIIRQECIFLIIWTSLCCVFAHYTISYGFLPHCLGLPYIKGGKLQRAKIYEKVLTKNSKKIYKKDMIEKIVHEISSKVSFPSTWLNIRGELK